MNRYLMLAIVWIAGASVFAQDAAAIAAQREADERERRNSSRLENLEQSISVQQKRIGELFRENESLRRQVVELENKFKNSQIGAVTSADIRKVYDKMGEIEKNRQADNALVKDQFVELKKLLLAQPVVVAPPADNNKQRREEKQREEKITEDPPAPFTGEYYPYKIQPRDNLSGIISRYNAELKAQGQNKAPITLDMVKKANPKLNPNNLVVGREIKIPIPPDR